VTVAASHAKHLRRPRIAIIGPVYPYRAGISYCTTRLAAELERDCDVMISSFRRQYPKRFYPGGEDIDPSLQSRTPAGARFALDVLNPLSWIMEAAAIRRWQPDVVIFVWWIWVWALPYIVLRNLLDPRTRVVFQCHNVGEKETSWWKRLLGRQAIELADAIIVHAKSEEDLARERSGRSVPPIHRLFLPVHELGTGIVSRPEARAKLGFDPEDRIALFFGHVRPFKGLDIAMRAWPRVRSRALLAVAGEFWWDELDSYRKIAREEGIESRVRIDPRFIPDDEIALWFGAADVVVAPYRTEAQSGVALTAFHFGRPVIASAVGGLPEIVREGKDGFLVPLENPGALAAAVDRFFNEADRSAMEAAARESAGKYSWLEYGSAVKAIAAGGEGSPK
jgi:glycosyltransferase involved in cell wall biosynthesis